MTQGTKASTSAVIEKNISLTVENPYSIYEIKMD